MEKTVCDRCRWPAISETFSSASLPSSGAGTAARKLETLVQNAIWPVVRITEPK